MRGGLRGLALLAAAVLGAAACGGGDGTVYEENVPVTAESETVILATTSILGDIVRNVAGERARVDVLMPSGIDPHEFEPSIEQVNSLYRVSLVVSNGMRLEEGMTEVLDIAMSEGVNLFELGTVAVGAGGMAGEDHEEGEHEGEHEEHEGEAGHEEGEHDHEGEADHEEGHDEGEHEGEGEHDEGEHDHEGEADHEEGEHEDHEGEEGHAHAHDHGGVDPHFWLDPILVAEGALALGEKLATFDGSEEWRAQAQTYADQMIALDAEIREILAVVPPSQRKLITNHDAFGYFAQRYGFQVLATVIPSTSSLAEPSSAHLAALVELIVEQGVPAIFVENDAAEGVAEAVAAEVGAEEVRVVELYAPWLGEPGSGADTLAGMLRVNAERIAEALA